MHVCYRCHRMLMDLSRVNSISDLCLPPWFYWMSRVLSLSLSKRRLIAFFCCRCCRITRPFIISLSFSWTSETLFPISRARAGTLYTRISPASAHFYCGRWCSHFELLCSLAHTHISHGRYWRNNFHLTNSAATARSELKLLLLLFTFRTPPRFNASHFKIDPSFCNSILYNAV